MSTLYRKYRPQTFTDLSGQEHVSKTLQNQVKLDQVAHAYLFSGPRGVGKTTSARLLAKALNCENRKKGETEPCNKCSACEHITNGQSLDIVEIDAASHTGVDNVRENIIANARVAPAASPFKVFIIDEVHMLSTSAFNALLKTLEEPPAHAIFILATTELHKLPSTIISRCQHYEFKRLTADQITERLLTISKREKVKVDKDVFNEIARHSEGCLRDAESLFGQILSLGEKNITKDVAGLVMPRSCNVELGVLVEALLNNQPKEALDVVQQLVDQGMDMKFVTHELLEYLRSQLVFSLTSQESPSVSPDKYQQLIELLLAIHDSVQVSNIPQLSLELLIAKWCFTDDNNLQIAKTSGSDNNKEVAMSPQKSAPPKNIKIKASSSVKDIQSKWKEVVAAVRQNHQALSTVIQSVQPVDLKEGLLTVGVGYKFHADMINENGNKDAIEQALSDVFGKKLSIETTIVNQASSQSLADEQINNQPKAGGSVSAIIDTFGGEVVE